MEQKEESNARRDEDLRRFCLEKAVQLLQGRPTSYFGPLDEATHLHPMDVAERLFRYVRYGEVNDYKELFYI